MSEEATQTGLSFAIPLDKMAELAEWMREQSEKVRELHPGVDNPYGAIGGAYTYSFTPTGLGSVITVKNGLTSEEIDLTDVDQW